VSGPTVFRPLDPSARHDCVGLVALRLGGERPARGEPYSLDASGIARIFQPTIRCLSCLGCASGGRDTANPLGVIGTVGPESRPPHRSRFATTASRDVFCPGSASSSCVAASRLRSRWDQIRLLQPFRYRGRSTTEKPAPITSGLLRGCCNASGISAPLNLSASFPADEARVRAARRTCSPKGKVKSPAPRLACRPTGTRVRRHDLSQRLRRARPAESRLLLATPRLRFVARWIPLLTNAPQDPPLAGARYGSTLRSGHSVADDRGAVTDALRASQTPRLRRDSPNQGSTNTRVPFAPLRVRERNPPDCDGTLVSLVVARSALPSPTSAGPGRTVCGWPDRVRPTPTKPSARTALRALRAPLTAFLRSHRLLRRHVAPTLALSPQLRSLRRSRSLRSSPWA